KLPTLGSLGSAQPRAALIAQVSSCLCMKGDRPLTTPTLPILKLWSSAPKAARQFRSKVVIAMFFALAEPLLKLQTYKIQTLINSS
ncbi:MAG: hypothetical protein SNJ81_12620, partial [Cyanobacteriota bacterium]